MSSEKPKPKTEEDFYKPIKDLLESIFASSYIESEKGYQRAPLGYRENPYLEITAKKRHFSEKLKKEFDDETFRIFSAERNAPDIMGFVKRKESSPKELITVEVKTPTITLLHILQAKLYQDIFKAKFGLLISPKGIREEKVRFVLYTKIGKHIRGKVIIAKFKEHPYGYAGRTFWTLEINPKFKDSVPEPFKRFCK